MASSPLPSYAFVVVSFFSVSGFAFSSAEENFSLHCPRFKCGNLTHIKYPFSNSSGCGLSIIDCVGENPMIRLGQRHYQRILLPFSGISGAVGAIILICLLFFMYRCRKQIIRETKCKILTPSTLLFEKGSYFGVPIFTYEELEEATDNFNPSNELGDGGFGTVYLGKLRDGRVVAVKRLYENSFKRLQQFMNEVEILTRLRHQNLVTLYGCTSRHSRELLLVYEFIPNGTVADHLHGNRAKAGLLTWPVRMNIAIQTADALAYLHSSDIIHSDVKTNNILLDNNFRVKVADFGLSRLFPTDVTHISTAPQGTPGYVDPEYYQCYRITNKSDVYSFGVVLIELISSKQAVDVNRHQREINLGNLAINKIQNRALHELVDPCLGFESDYAVRRMTTLVAELSFRCLQQEREMRPSMDEVLEVLRGIDQEEDYNLEKAEEVDIPVDDVRLLKSTPSPRLPDSTSDKWGRVFKNPSSKYGEGESSGTGDGIRKGVKYYRCGKLGHIKKNCRVNLKGENVAENEESKGDEEWGKCFMVGTTSVDALNAINFENDWIIDSGCGHHLTGDDSKFSRFRDYNGNGAIITADNSIHPVEKE
ncbi:hypothetical protein HHK36_031621 [Tetracentron sinense]|uniref:non-specific serine/threonine protein kinase n=1 Tax=Tetracentron sinense TaxID=13715 RepID=A0A834YC70_TETSI|nr:hypothetical protein HHK36_031621 [Tetracentron sinense]